VTVKLPDAGAAPDEAAFDEAHRQLISDDAIQFTLPAPEQSEPPEWLKRFFEWLADRAPEEGGEPGWLESLFSNLEGVSPGLGTAFYVMIGLLVLLALFLLARFVMSRRWARGGGDEEKAFDWRPEAGPAQALLGEADALAARGLFSEAARLLLFRSIADIDSRRPELVRPAFTSRDIAALVQIPPPPRVAFARIAMQVERALFAQRPLAEGDWRDCRAAYEEFAFADGWGG